MASLEPDDLQPAPLRSWLWTACVHYRRVVGWLLLFYAMVLPIELIEAPILYLLPYGLPQFASACLHMLLGAGPVFVCLAQLKGEPWSFGTFFRGFRREWAWQLVGYFVALIIIAIGVMLLLLVPVAILFWLFNSFLALVWKPIHNDFVVIYGSIYIGFCSLVAATFTWVRFRFFALPLMFDRGLTVDEALGKAWELSRGRWGLLLKAALVLASFHLLVFLPAVVMGIASELAIPAFNSTNRNHSLADWLGAIAGILAAAAVAAQLLIYPFTALATSAGYMQMSGRFRATPLKCETNATEPILK